MAQTLASGQFVINPFNFFGDYFIVWVTGDSILRGTSTSFDDGPEPDYAGTVYEYTGSNIVEITSGDLASAQIGSMWPKLGQSIYRLTGKKVLFINSGFGGSSFAPDVSGTNNWSATGSRYSAAKTVLDAALLKAHRVKPDLILTGTAVNDARNTGVVLSTIETEIHAFTVKLQTDYPDVPIGWINVGRREAGEDSRIVAIRTYIEDQATDYTNVHIVARLENYTSGASNYYDDDNLHLMQYGNDYVATVIAKYLKDNSLIPNTPIVRANTTEALAVFAQMPNTLTDYEKEKINDFVSFLQRKGYWANIDSYYFPLLSDESNSRKDWKRTSKSFTGGTWASGQGVSTDGTTGNAINTNFTPSTDATAFQRINNQSWVWVYDAITTGVDAVLMGVIGTTSSWKIELTQTSAGQTEYADITATTVTEGIPLRDHTNYGLRRVAVGSNFMVVNAGSISGTATVAAQMPNLPIYIGCMNNNSTLEEPYQGKYYDFGFGIGTEAANQSIYRKRRGLIIDFLIGL